METSFRATARLDPLHIVMPLAMKAKDKGPYLDKWQQFNLDGAPENEAATTGLIENVKLH